MKALSLKQPWAAMIASGEKTIETRTWKTDYRGDLLICASQSVDESCTEEIWHPIFGHALCVVRLVDCVPMTAIHEAAAKCAVYPKAWAWILEDVRAIESFPVKGKLGLFEVEVKV